MSAAASDTRAPSPATTAGSVVRGFIVAGMPHPLLAPERSPAWSALRRAYDRAAAEIARSDADTIIYYSTQWVSVIGHQIQAHPKPEWVHVDQDWHALGSMPYCFRGDVELANAWEQAARARGLHARTVAYDGFPIDTGTIVAQKLLNPDNRLPFTVASCNMYADRAETLVLGKAAADAVHATGRRAIAVAVTALSHRLFPQEIDPAEDRLSSLKDDEWNRKLLEILARGRLEDVSQLAREFTRQANADSKLKAVWWLAALMGQHNNYEGEVYGYGPVWGTGACVVSLTPTARAAAGQEYDEEDVEVFGGDRNVLDAKPGADGDAAAESGHGTAPGGARPRGGAPAAGRPPAAPEAAGAGAWGFSGGAPIHVTPAPVPSSVSLPAGAPPTRASKTSSFPRGAGTVMTPGAPKPVGAYPHARRVGDLLYLSGIGPRHPVTDEIPGGPVRDADGNPRDYDVAAQTRATIENIRAILEAGGSSLDRVLDVTAFLINMDRDFEAYNRVYAEYFASVGATRTTLAVSALPTPIAVELKVIASAGA